MAKRKKALVHFEDCQNCPELLLCIPLGSNIDVSKNNCIFREEIC